MTAWRAAAVLAFASLAPGMTPMPAHAQHIQVLHEITIDIDRDGRPDRAALVQPASDPAVYLYLYLGAGTDALDLSRRPSVTKEITTDPIRAFADKGAGSLLIKWGRGGANDYEVGLTIVHRRGRFLVGGLTHDWDTRSGMGSCDINFLTGRGVASRGLAKTKPIRTRFKPVALADWSDDKHPKACNG